MDETRLIDRLASFDPPDAELARARAVEAVPARVHAARAAERRRPHRRLPRLAGAGAAAVVLAVAFSLLTAPGQAFTSWVGDRLGLGQPGGPAALKSLRNHALGVSAGQPAYVLLRGPGPLGDDYEFVTYRTKAQPGKEFPANGARCYQLQFPQIGNLFGAGCGLPPASGGLLYGGVGGNSAAGMAYWFASGRVSDDVASVDLEVDGRAIPVELRSIPADLLERFEIRRPFKFFIAFFDADIRGGEVIVTARDEAGDPVAVRSSTLPAAPLARP